MKLPALLCHLHDLTLLSPFCPGPTPQTVPQRLYDELAAKLSIVERRRAEDRDKLRDYDRLVEEQGEWERVREKTKARVAELAGEVKELKREVSRERTRKGCCIESAWSWS